MDFVFEDLSFTLGRLRADRFASGLAASLLEFRKEFFVVLLREFDLREALQAAQASIYAQDDELNEVSDAVIAAVLSLSKGGYKDELYKHYCGEKRPSEFKRPILGEQLESVRGWGHSLQNPATAPALAGLSAVVNISIAMADQAVTQRDKAQQDSADFRRIGERKRLIDSFQALRLTLYAQLQEIQKSTTERKLPADYAERFFRRLRVQSAAESRVETRRLEEEIVGLEQQLNERRALLAELKEQDEERRRDEAALEETLNALAESQKLAEEAKKKADALRARLGKK
jgi:hypothetical protein